MKKHRGIAVVLAGPALIIALPVVAGAEVSYQVPIGARGIGMGGAFSAVADDATAIYWNPAGLPLIGHQEVTGGHANLFGSEIRDSFISFVLPLTPSQAVGIDWYHSGYSDSELDFGENRIDLAYGRRIGSRFSAGAVVKYLNRNTGLDGFEVRRGSGFGIDFGVLYQPIPMLRIAGVGQDAFDTELKYSAGNGNVVAFPRTLRAGAALTPWSWGTVAVDVDDRLHVGAEYRPAELLALRAGLQDDVGGPEGTELSFGAGIRWSVLRFDYAYVDHPVLGGTSHFGLSLGFNFNPSQIRIEKVETRDIYTSLYRSYSHEPLGSVRVRNLEDTPVRARLRVMVPELMGEPSEQEVILRPRATQDLPLTAVFPDRVLDRSGDRPVQVQVSATYQSLRLARTEKSSARCIAYGPGAIDWSRGVDQAAAFVTPRDPQVESLARAAVRGVEGTALSSGNRNLDFAAAILNAVAALGVAYVPDPNNPYATISGESHAVDTILYPAETLSQRTGDCDDTTVLFAALLGNVGIRTKFVAVPGHIFLLFSTDVHERNRLALRLDDSRFTVQDGEIWIPIETTALSRGFLEAWRVGAESYADWESRGQVDLVDVGQAQLRYAPGVPGTSASPPDFDPALLEAGLNRDLTRLDEERRAFMAERFGDLEGSRQPATPGALNELAYIQFAVGRFDEARELLDQAARLEPGSPRTLNNLGAVRASAGDLEEAVEDFRRAAVSGAGDPGIWLNLGLVLHAGGDSAAAVDPLARGVNLSGGIDAACLLLGLDPAAGSLRAGTKRMTRDEARRLLQAAMQSIPAAASDSTAAVGARPAPVDPDRKSPKWVARTAGARGSDRFDLGGLLYWKK